MHYYIFRLFSFLSACSIAEAIQAIEEILTNNVDTRLIEDALNDLNLLGDLVQKIQSGQAQGSSTFSFA